MILISDILSEAAQIRVTGGPVRKLTSDSGQVPNVILPDMAGAFLVRGLVAVSG